MAPGAHDVVLRDLPAIGIPARLPSVSSRLHLALQQLLQHGLRSAVEEASRLVLAAVARGNSRLPPPCGRGDDEAHRKWRYGRRPAAHSARPAPRAAAPGAAGL